ncbi:hypothetical protein [Maricaulis sp.]|uniref:hypothetical protein n=1 Tax=Maricaulis sp. TaxID=1486257 RepID=UPI0026220C87|nr:hypothetical protein [Maricaulis sp.]
MYDDLLYEDELELDEIDEMSVTQTAGGLAQAFYGRVANEMKGRLALAVSRGRSGYAQVWRLLSNAGASQLNYQIMRLAYEMMAARNPQMRQSSQGIGVLQSAARQIAGRLGASLRRQRHVFLLRFSQPRPGMVN